MPCVTFVFVVVSSYLRIFSASGMSEAQVDVVLTLLEVVATDRIPLQSLVEALQHSMKRLEASVKFAKLLLYVLEAFSHQVCTFELSLIPV